MCAADSGVIYDTMGEYIFKSSDVCVCAAHSGRIYHTLVQSFMGMCVRCTQWTGLSHSGRAYFQQLPYVYCTQWAGLSHSGFVYFQKFMSMCVLHTVDGSITQWADIFSTAAM